MPKMSFISWPYLSILHPPSFCLAWVKSYNHYPERCLLRTSCFNHRVVKAQFLSDIRRPSSQDFQISYRSSRIQRLSKKIFLCTFLVALCISLTFSYWTKKCRFQQRWSHHRCHSRAINRFCQVIIKEVPYGNA